MKKSIEERVKSRLLNIGRKNAVLRVLIIPVLFVVMSVFHLGKYFRNNGKRFAMMAMCCFLFSVFSSFSFPAFIMGQDAGTHSLDVEGAQNVSLAQETELNMDEVQLLYDEDVLEDFEYSETSHGYAMIDKYDATEILESNEARESKNTEQHGDGDSDEALPEDVDGGKADTEAEVTFRADDWRLVLINKQHSVPDDYEVKLGAINTIKGSMKCDERIIDDMLDMFADAKEEGVVLAVCSPYRDLEYQEMLFNRKMKRYMGMGMSYMEAYQLSSQVVTVPGASEHQIGLALDIICNEYTALDEGFGETEAGKWLAENSCKYGFILRYPEGKEYITGIDYEPWHFRYVGKEAATLITEQGITLEEFWEEYL